MKKKVKRIDQNEKSCICQQQPVLEKCRLILLAWHQSYWNSFANCQSLRGFSLLIQKCNDQANCIKGIAMFDRKKQRSWLFFSYNVKSKLTMRLFLPLFIHCVMSKKYFRNKPDLFRHRQFDKLVNIHVNQTPAAIYAWDEKFDWVLLCFFLWEKSVLKKKLKPMTQSCGW